MNYVAQCLEKFRHLPENIQNILGGFNTLLTIKKLEKEYGAPLSFLVVLVAINELKLNDIPNYLEQKYGFDEEDAFDLWNELTRKVFSLLLFVPNQYLSFGSENDITETLSKKIKKLFSNSEEAQLFNLGLFFLLATKGNLQEKLVKILLNNQEELTSAEFILKNKKVLPSIANWLQDFIEENGSELFDELKLEQYLINSENVKKLSDEEKKLVRKLLQFYCNLAFFPESMENIPVNEWVMIPVSLSNQKKSSRNLDDVLGDNSNFLDNKVSNTSSISATEPAIVSLAELEAKQKEYSSSSLEYKALSQEISRLKQSSLARAKQKASTRNLNR